MIKDFKVKWGKTCYMCGCPMNLSVSFDYDPDFIKYIINYYNIVPIDFSNNLPIYKFFGMKVRRICMACYENPIKHIHTNIRRRELGMRHNLRHQDISRTHKEIYQWFEGFNRFIYIENVEKLYFPQTLKSDIIWGLFLQANFRTQLE